MRPPQLRTTTRTALAVAAVLLMTAACAPHPQWVAVAGADSSVVLVFRHDLTPADTLEFNAPGPNEVSIMQFAADGASLTLVLAREDQTADLLRLRRTDGATLDRSRLDFRPRSLTPLIDARSMLLAGTGRTADSGVVQFLRHYPLEEIRRLGSCGDPVEAQMLKRGERIFVLCSSDQVSEVDPSLGIVVNTKSLSPLEPGDSVPLRHCGAADASLSRSQTVLLVTCAISGELLYLDRVTLEELASVELPGEPTGIALSPSGEQALVTLADQGTVILVNLETRQIAHSFRLPGTVRDVRYSARDRWAYTVTAERPGQGGWLLRLNLELGAVDSEHRLSTSPSALAVWPGNHLPFLAWTPIE